MAKAKTTLAKEFTMQVSLEAEQFGTKKSEATGVLAYVVEDVRRGLLSGKTSGDVLDVKGAKIGHWAVLGLK